MLATTSDEGVPNPRNCDGMLRTSDRIAAAVAYFPPTDIRTWLTNGKWKHYEGIPISIRSWREIIRRCSA